MIHPTLPHLGECELIIFFVSLKEFGYHSLYDHPVNRFEKGEGF